ncbi:MAG: Acetyl-coenzyme A carboxylase carboxyl transferase subunit beta [Chlamydiae bacterium]|nr:Acetyl-coenzyme A carboxylase carboxyl transferase subunit beta [Chlamydiota bacterium]
MKLFSKSKPKIKVQETKRESFDGWLKCTHCKELVHLKELEQNTNCCPKCDYHYRISIYERLKLLTDEGSFQEMYEDLSPLDPLNFKDTETYKSRIAKAQKKTSRKEGVITGVGTIDGQPTAIGVLDFAFMGGSMGSVVGEKLTLIIEHAISEQLPVVIVSASGGARMQESALSLMQMAKTSAALAKLSKCSLPYISILTNPTTGGITASFASLGDVIIAEPKALICFAGPRVIEQTIGEKLPPEAQKSEFLLEHGMLDCVVRRKDLKNKISTFIKYLMPEKLLKKNRKLSLENLKGAKLVSLEKEIKKTSR